MSISLIGGIVPIRAFRGRVTGSYGNYRFDMFRPTVLGSDVDVDESLIRLILREHSSLGELLFLPEENLPIVLIVDTPERIDLVYFPTSGNMYMIFEDMIKGAKTYKIARGNMENRIYYLTRWNMKTDDEPRGEEREFIILSPSMHSSLVEMFNSLRRGEFPPQHVLDRVVTILARSLSLAEARCYCFPRPNVLWLDM